MERPIILGVCWSAVLSWRLGCFTLFSLGGVLHWRVGRVFCLTVFYWNSRSFFHAESLELHSICACPRKNNIPWARGWSCSSIQGSLSCPSMWECALFRLHGAFSRRNGAPLEFEGYKAKGLRDWCRFSHNLQNSNIYKALTILLSYQPWSSSSFLPLCF